jgi:hypothetical protein
MPDPCHSPGIPMKPQARRVTPITDAAPLSWWKWRPRFQPLISLSLSTCTAASKGQPHRIFLKRGIRVLQKPQSLLRKLSRSSSRAAFPVPPPSALFWDSVSPPCRVRHTVHELDDVLHLGRINLLPPDVVEDGAVTKTGHARRGPNARAVERITASRRPRIFQGRR